MVPGRLLIATIALMVLAVTACGDGDGDGTRAQPSPDGTAFVGGSFGDIPVPPLADPLGPEIVEDDGTVGRSYAVRDRTPRATMDFYVKALADEPMITDVHDVAEEGGATVLRGEWLFDDRRLRVTVQPAPTVEGSAGEREADQVVQLSLLLFPE